MPARMIHRVGVDVHIGGAFFAFCFDCDWTGDTDRSTRDGAFEDAWEHEEAVKRDPEGWAA